MWVYFCVFGFILICLGVSGCLSIFGSFGYIWVYLDFFGFIWMFDYIWICVYIYIYLGLFGYIWLCLRCLDVFGYSWLCLDMFEMCLAMVGHI